MARQQTQRAVHRTGCGPAVQISSHRTYALQVRRYKPNGLSCVGCNVGGLPQVLKKPKTIAKLKEKLQVIWDNHGSYGQGVRENHKIRKSQGKSKYEGAEVNKDAEKF